MALLSEHFERLKTSSLEGLAESRTSAQFTVGPWTLNASRQRLDTAADQALLQFAEAQGISAAIADLLSGAHVNPSEDRPALHWALRSPNRENPIVGEIRQTLDAPLDFAESVRKDGKFKTVLHLGIGGSDFGPRLLHDASKDDYENEIDVRFAANLDPLDLDRALAGLDPKTTLVIGVSKSFSSEETMYNLNRTRDWLKASVGDAWPDNLALVTASPDKAMEWLGRKSENIFDMPISVGGRYSLWSAASLCCMIAFGRSWFETFLEGAFAIDEHVRTAALGENLALKLAMYDYWNMTVSGMSSNIVLSYSNALRMLPTYLQQLELESNGKSTKLDGSPVETKTISALWGGEGTIGQHSYHQWLHQGTTRTTAEFVIATNPKRDPAGTQALIAHALAQSEVLANGRSEDAIAVEEPDLPADVRKQKVMPGGNPSLLLICTNFDVYALGALIALYEHRTFLAGRLWEINSFDQWGVELGKRQAGRIKNALATGSAVSDPVTAQLVSFFKT